MCLFVELQNLVKHLWLYMNMANIAVIKYILLLLNKTTQTTTNRIPEMLGHFFNLNKMKTKRLSNHVSQYFIHNRT